MRSRMLLRRTRSRCREGELGVGRRCQSFADGFRGQDEGQGGRQRSLSSVDLL